MLADRRHRAEPGRFAVAQRRRRDDRGEAVLRLDRGPAQRRMGGQLRQAVDEAIGRARRAEPGGGLVAAQRLERAGNAGIDFGPVGDPRGVAFIARLRRQARLVQHMGAETAHSRSFWIEISTSLPSEVSKAP